MDLQLQGYTRKVFGVLTSPVDVESLKEKSGPRWTTPHSYSSLEKATQRDQHVMSCSHLCSCFLPSLCCNGPLPTLGAQFSNSHRHFRT